MFNFKKLSFTLYTSIFVIEMSISFYLIQAWFLIIKFSDKTQFPDAIVLSNLHLF